MGKMIGAVILGYIAMFVVVFIALTGLYFILGPDGAFEEASFAPSSLWIAAMIVVSFVAAVIGGMLCAKIAPNSKAPVALVVVVIVLGLVSAAGSFQAPDPDAPTVRGAELGSMDAMMAARTPAWVAVLNPIIGALGVIVGARRKNE